MSGYSIQIEISGPTALWARPDTMPNPVSYVAPTHSAVKGIFEAVLRWENVVVWPTACEICRPVQFHRYAFNYGGPLRKEKHIKKGASLQLFAQVLINVCYRLYAEVEWCNEYHDGVSPTHDYYRRNADIEWFSTSRTEEVESPKGTISPHAYVEVFKRRLGRGRWFYTPCLGWKEFAPDYIGVFRDGTSVCAGENHVIPAFLEMVFDHPQHGGRGQTAYLRNLKVTDGRLEYKDGETDHAE
jgi:CRISPR-associated protein Cas5d